ncbi:MAG: YiiX/YebB-like N1pC/P60 family cysteine hydrolase [Aeromicrobium erythreum]
MIRKHARAVALMAALVVGVAPAATAAESDGTSAVDELVRLNPGTTADEMRSAIAAEAKASGRTDQEVADATLAEARSESGQIGVRQNRVASSGGGADKSKRLGKARQGGDVFWYDSATDHVGLYTSAAYIVEAPGAGKVVRKLQAKSKKVPSKTYKMAVKVSQAKRNASAAWATTKRGKAYNLNFAFNKKVTASKYNCSQLVWAAYKAKAKVDLDSNGGTGVYPGNIRDSKKVSIYSKKQG